MKWTAIYNQPPTHSRSAHRGGGQRLKKKVGKKDWNNALALLKQTLHVDKMIEDENDTPTGNDNVLRNQANHQD